MGFAIMPLREGRSNGIISKRRFWQRENGPVQEAVDYGEAVSATAVVVLYRAFVTFGGIASIKITLTIISVGHLALPLVTCITSLGEAGVTDGLEAVIGHVTWMGQKKVIPVY